MIFLLLSIRDFELLKLLCWCKNIPAPTGKTVSKLITQNDFSVLEFFGLLTKSRDKKNIRPTTAAYRLLNDAGFDFKQDAKPQTSAATLERRNNAAEILLTFYRAGIPVFNHDIAANNNQAMYMAASAARQHSTGNVYGSTRFYGIFCTRDTAYIVFYIDDVGVYYNQELALFHKLIQDTNLKNTAIIFMGKSLSSIGANVLRTAKNKKKSSNGKTNSFLQIFETTVLPVHFIPTGDAGAEALRFMQIPNYREAIARAILKSHYKPPYEGLSDTDTIHRFQDHPPYPALVVVDMDIHRIDRALEGARELGFDKIVLYTLETQAQFLKNRYAGRALVLKIDVSNIKHHLGQDIELYCPPSTLYISNEGRSFDVTDLAAYRKAGK